MPRERRAAEYDPADDLDSLKRCEIRRRGEQIGWNEGINQARFAARISREEIRFAARHVGPERIGPLDGNVLYAPADRVARITIRIGPDIGQAEGRRVDRDSHRIVPRDPTFDPNPKPVAALLDDLDGCARSKMGDRNPSGPGKDQGRCTRYSLGSVVTPFRHPDLSPDRMWHGDHAPEDEGRQGPQAKSPTCSVKHNLSESRIGRWPEPRANRGGSLQPASLH
jgi:hypothetical protein